jgi:hypothetical protein
MWTFLNKSSLTHQEILNNFETSRVSVETKFGLCCNFHALLEYKVKNYVKSSVESISTDVMWNARNLQNFETLIVLVKA